MGLVVELNTTNMTLYRYQRVGVVICQYSSAEIKLKQRAEANAGETSKSDEAVTYVVNEFLSGYYIIDSIEYIYKKPGPLRQRLYLIKREYKAPK
jgi:hypothetical protein